MDVPLRMLELRSPRLLFDGVLPDSKRRLDITDVKMTQALEVPIPTPVTIHCAASEPQPASNHDMEPVSIDQENALTLKERLKSVSDRYEWQVRDRYLFIPHPEAAREMGIDPLGLIEALDSQDWLEPGGAGNLRKVRVMEGRRGLLLNHTVSEELLGGMKVPQRKSRRNVDVRK